MEYISYNFDDIDIRPHNYDIIMDQIESDSINSQSDNSTDISNSMYMIGLGLVIDDRIIVESTIPTKIFFNNTGDQILDYLLYNSISHPNWQRIEIMELVLTNNQDVPWVTRNCVFKTHYLRLVQRKWRSILKERRSLIYPILRKRELGIKSDIPKLEGMLKKIKN
jgi:hypothetical protein